MRRLQWQDGKGFYVADGNWDLVGGNSNGPQTSIEKEGHYFKWLRG